MNITFAWSSFFFTEALLMQQVVLLRCSGGSLTKRSVLVWSLLLSLHGAPASTEAPSQLTQPALKHTWLFSQLPQHTVQLLPSVEDCFHLFVFSITHYYQKLQQFQWALGNTAFPWFVWEKQPLAESVTCMIHKKCDISCWVKSF